ncbi:hypothetical protein CPB85DRAFT_332425 [Mucidula mucida]|nr:hypothetical protein CPB85DRAFT_332425 [Mucidula mucida]
MSYARLPEPSHPTPMPSFKPSFLSPNNFRPNPQMSAVRRRKLIFSYAPDWILTIALAYEFERSIIRVLAQDCSQSHFLLFGQGGRVPPRILFGRYFSSPSVSLSSVHSSRRT